MQPIDVPISRRRRATPSRSAASVLRLDHVVIIIIRETHAQAVARLGRAAVADTVGQDDVVAGEVERLAGPVKLVGELRREELPPGAAGAVEHHHRIVDLPGRIAVRRAERRIMDAQLGQRSRPRGSGNP